MLTNIDDICHKVYILTYLLTEGGLTMSSSLNLSLTKELRSFVDSRTGDTGLFSTPSEYLIDLIRHDMVSQETVSHILQGVRDIKLNQISDLSILDIAEE